MILLLPIAVSAGCAGASDRSPTLILISLDGFRWDYRQKTETPVLDRLAEGGVEAEGLIPVFPSKTFPNHYSLVTGLYPENHGIVSNNMYDPEFDAYFSLSNRESVGAARWWGGEPIWVTAENQGKRTAVLFWPGSEAAVGGVRPSYWSLFDSGMSYQKRIDQALAWLDLPSGDRPVFIALYFSLVDSVGHDYGPESEQVQEAVHRMDAVLGRLVEGLKQRGLLGAVNLLLTSDHGMAETSPDRVIVLDDYIDLDRVEVVDWSPVAAMIPEPDYLEAALAQLRGAHPHLRAYQKEQMPERLHYRDHRRIPPLLALADEGWVIMSRERYRRRLEGFSLGAHGYDNRLRSMHGFFQAHGPAFRRGVRVEPLLNLHLFPLMAHLLDLKAPPPSDGDLEAVRHLLR